jgi:hypothetical protein
LRSRLWSIAAVSALAVALVVPALALSSTSAAAAPAAQVEFPSQDFATSTFGDPWDMSNSSDMNLAPMGPTLYVTGQRMASGMVSLNASRVSYVSLLWNGFPGSLPYGRDGRIAANQIIASRYTRLYAHIWASRQLTVWVQWGNTCARCSGQVQVVLQPGWNDVSAPLNNDAVLRHSGTAWSGRIQSLRLQFLPSASTGVRIDSVRLLHSSATSVLHWASPSSRGALLYWTDDGVFSPTLSQHSGVVPGGTSSGSSNAVTTDISDYAPGTTFYAYDGSSATLIGSMASQPIVVIDSPSAQGCGDYALRAIGHRWVFTSPSSVAGIGDATDVTFSRTGVLSAVNAGPNRNDPYVLLRLGAGGINPKIYHRLTIVASYDGPFGLANAPGGGTLGRVLWKEPGHTAYSQTNDLVMYPGLQTISLDMAMPTATLTEPDGTAAQRYAFSSAARVTILRWDPNEDPGARHWHLDSVTLSADCTTNTSIPLTWHDGRYTAGSVATVVAVSGSRSVVLAQGLAENPGVNSYQIVAGRLAPGNWSVRVTVGNPAGASFTAAATGPLVITPR